MSPTDTELKRAQIVGLQAETIARLMRAFEMYGPNAPLGSTIVEAVVSDDLMLLFGSPTNESENHTA